MFAVLTTSRSDASTKPSPTVIPLTDASGTGIGVTTGALLTVTVTVADVAVLPEPSRATAVSVCGPLLAVDVLQRIEYGAARTSEPRFAPSSLNWTPATPT